MVVKCVKDYQLTDATITIMEELLLILMDTICTVWIHIRVLSHRFQGELPLKNGVKYCMFTNTLTVENSCIFVQNQTL